MTSPSMRVRPRWTDPDEPDQDALFGDALPAPECPDYPECRRCQAIELGWHEITDRKRQALLDADWDRDDVHLIAEAATVGEPGLSFMHTADVVREIMGNRAFGADGLPTDLPARQATAWTVAMHSSNTLEHIREAGWHTARPLHERFGDLGPLLWSSTLSDEEIAMLDSVSLDEEQLLTLISLTNPKVAPLLVRALRRARDLP